MKKKGLLVIIWITFYGISSNSQTIDLNDYINNRVKKIGNLNHSYFNSGYVIKNKDTILCSIYMKKGKVTNDSYLFTITKDDKDSLSIFSVNDIEGYLVNDIEFRRFKTRTGTVFIRLVKRGRIDLYEKYPTPDNEEFAYYLFTSESKIFSIEPFTENIFDEFRGDGKVTNNQGNLMNTKFKKIDEKFKFCFSKLLSDCPEVVNLITSGFYGINNIEELIEIYNNCKKE